ARPVPLAESALTPNAASLPQWRILNPVLCWPWWLAFFALVARAVAAPTRWRVVAAGVACGLLFYVYFYLWTAAVAGLVLAAVVSAALRRLTQTAATGLQIANFPWIFALGPALSLLVVLVAAGLFGRLPPRAAQSGPALAGALAVAAVAAGGWLYARAATG